MSEKPDEEKKLVSIATDMELSIDLRHKSVDLLGSLGSREALLALLTLAANEKLTVSERDHAIKRAREIIKSNR